MVGGSRVMRCCVLASALAATVIVSVGCGGESEESGGPASASQAQAPQVPAYDGPEADLPGKYGEPEIKSDVELTFGLLNPFDGSPALHAWQGRIEEETERLGVTLIAKDAGLDPNTQVSQCNDLLAQKVDALLIYPVDPNAMTPCVAEAAAAGIPVIARDTPPIASEELLPGYDSVVLSARDLHSYETAKAAAEVAPGTSFAMLGLGVPVPLLKYGMERTGHWATTFGMKRLGQVDTQEDTPAGNAQTASGLLAKYPDAEVIFTYNDIAAQATARVARSSGREVLIFGHDAEPAAVDMILRGELAGSYGTNAREMAIQMVHGGYNMVTEQNLPLPPQLAVPGEMVTKENAKGFESLY